MFASYIKYIKDNPKGYWFRAKLYGWGWTPATWQGWAIIAIFLGYLLWISSALPVEAELNNTILVDYYAKLALGVIVLIAICFKTGEKPHWSWGLKKKK